MADLRAGMDGPLEGSGGGPPPFRKEDRSRFLQALDRELVRLGRRMYESAYWRCVGVPEG